MSTLSPSDDELLQALRDLQRALGRRPRILDLRDDMPGRSVYLARFGRWNAALEAAGIQPAPKRRWTRKAIIEALRRYAEEFGRPPAYDLLRLPPAGYPSSKRASKVFGSWSAALEAAGLTSAPGGRRVSVWPAERIVAAVRDFAERMGRPPVQEDFGRDGLPSEAIACRVFGTLGRAREAAGVPLERRRVPPDDAITALQEAARRLGRSPSERAYSGLGLSPSTVTIRTLFGGWQQALVAAGLPPTPTRTLRGYARRSDEELLAMMRLAAARCEGPLTLARFREVLVDAPSESVIRNRFGSWADAMAQAGLPLHPRARCGPKPSRAGVERRQARQRSRAARRERILQEIAAVAESGTPPTLRWWTEHRSAVATEATLKRLFGSWTAALTAAGVEARPVAEPANRIGDQELLDALRSASRELGGTPPTASWWKATARRPTARTIRVRFGSWEAALQAAGLEEPAPSAVAA